MKSGRETSAVKRLGDVLLNISEAGSLLCGILLILSAIYVSAELLSRKFLNLALIGSNEISGYVVAIGTSWAFSYALLKRSHIRIDVFYRYLPPRWLFAVDVLASISLTAFGAIFVWYATHFLEQNWTRNSHSITSLDAPLWIPVGAWYLGWAMFLITSIYVSVGSLFAYLRGDYDTVRQLAGSISQREEAELEINPEASLGDDAAKSRG